MMRGDALMERGAERLQELSQKMAASGGLQSKLAEPLAEDAALLRRMKPSLVVARARGEAPTNLAPNSNVVAPSGPLLGRRRKRGAGGLNPFLVAGLAFAVGIGLAKILDWRGHAHPKD